MSSFALVTTKAGKNLLSVYEMFEAAKAEKQSEQSELVPFWCFGKNQSDE